MSAKVLIIGGAGYVGGITADILEKKGYSVCIYDNLMYESRFLKRIPFVFGDIRDTAKVLETAKDFDVVILMAALVGDPACAVNIALTDAINREAIRSICYGLDNSKHIIFLSTCSVYGAQDKILDEESETNPLSAYASTKLKAEKYVLQKNGTVFRLGTVYGVGDTYSRIRLDLVANVLAMKAVYEHKIQIFGGEQWRPLICVKDISGYIAESIDRNIRGLYILSQFNMTMKDLGEKIVELFPDTKIAYTDILFEDARNYKVNPVKSNKQFYYRPKCTIENEMVELAYLFVEGRIKNIGNIVYHNGNFLRKEFINHINY